MKMDKYLYFKYEDYITAMLANTKLSIADKTKILLIKENCNNSPFFYIIEDLYKLVMNNFSTKQLSDIYNVGIRTTQIWLKDMGLHRTFEEGHNLSRNNVHNINSSMKPNVLTTHNKNYCIYRFLDKYMNVLYIGKCEKSYHSNGRGGSKEYFIKDRLVQHYTPSSKQLPKSLYLNTKYIEVCFPSVKSGKDLEILESQLISYYEREKLQCDYNLELISGIDYIQKDNMEWVLYEEKTERDIKILLKKYKCEEIPKVEIINQRLKAILWYIDSKKSN